MKKLVAFLLELCRIVFLLLITLYVLDKLERILIKMITGKIDFHWSMTIGNLLLFFIMYRNYFQFNGWYKSKQNKKLSRTTSKIFISISIGFIIVPILINV